jgi:hypothetical protein
MKWYAVLAAAFLVGGLVTMAWAEGGAKPAAGAKGGGVAVAGGGAKIAGGAVVAPAGGKGAPAGGAAGADGAAEPPAKKEMFYLAKVTNRSGDTEYQVLSASELGVIEKEIKDESRYHARALMNTERAWKADENTKKQTFPRSAIEQRKIQTMQSFGDRQKADDKMASIQKRQAEEMIEEAEKAKKKGQGNPHQQKDPASLRKEQEREAERRSREEQVRMLYETKLGELMSGAKEAPAADAAADAAKAPANAPAKK